mmetsp:Transcript_32054/g.52278  ORF Transcript_32054/g.52278 Transcript_32054/m.52278 type:complete len:138 (+) Transcript_32054:329-742(+)
MVTIVRTGADGDSYSQSYLQGYIEEGKEFQIDDFAGSGTNIIVPLSIDKTTSVWKANVWVGATTPHRQLATGNFLDSHQHLLGCWGKTKAEGSYGDKGTSYSDTYVCLRPGTRSKSAIHTLTEIAVLLWIWILLCLL